jgi:hypothetical protein
MKPKRYYDSLEECKEDIGESSTGHRGILFKSGFAIYEIHWITEKEGVFTCNGKTLGYFASYTFDDVLA